MSELRGEHAPFVGEGPHPGYEYITGVANMFDGDKLVALPKPHRHHHIFSLCAFAGIGWDTDVQGFMTNEGRFVSRIEARKLAEAADQPRRWSGHIGDTMLYSEDLW